MKNENIGVYRKQLNMVTAVTVPFEDLPLTEKYKSGDYKATVKLCFYENTKLRKTKFVTDDEFQTIVAGMESQGYRKI